MLTIQLLTLTQKQCAVFKKQLKRSTYHYSNLEETLGETIINNNNVSGYYRICARVLSISVNIWCTNKVHFKCIIVADLVDTKQQCQETKLLNVSTFQYSEIAKHFFLLQLPLTEFKNWSTLNLYTLYCYFPICYSNYATVNVK